MDRRGLFYLMLVCIVSLFSLSFWSLFCDGFCRKNMFLIQELVMKFDFQIRPGVINLWIASLVANNFFILFHRPFFFHSEFLSHSQSVEANNDRRNQFLLLYATLNRSLNSYPMLFLSPSSLHFSFHTNPLTSNLRLQCRLYLRVRFLLHLFYRPYCRLHCCKFHIFSGNEIWCETVL